MENIILTNNKDLRLVGVKVGVFSTLSLRLPLVSAAATNVEVVVTDEGTHSAYTATYNELTHCWICDIAAAQFSELGKQSYEVAYRLNGAQYWDGKGWIEVIPATVSGITPTPRPEPYRYTVVSVNGAGADTQGNVRIPQMYCGADSPQTTEGYIEGDQYCNSATGATWTLCDVSGELTWVFALGNYYTKAETDEQINKLAAYYITSDIQGNPFATYAALVGASTYYSGGVAREPTRNDYAVVLADETHGGAEYRYIYAIADGAATGHWEAQYPIETNDYSGLANKPSINSVVLDGNKTGAQLGLANATDLTPLQLAALYPEGGVTSAAEFTAGIKYTFDSQNHTASVKPFCNTGTAADDNSSLAGRVVIPPFVDAQGNGYISDDGTRFKVVGVRGDYTEDANTNLTSIIAPNTVTSIGNFAFYLCTSLASISLPAATSIGDGAFYECTSLVSISLPDATSIGVYAFCYCTSLASISLPDATSIGNDAFNHCTSLASVSLPAATSIGATAFGYCTSLASVSIPSATSIGTYAFYNCTSLASVDFGATARSSVPTLGSNAFKNVPASCKIIVPDSQYTAWTTASGWSGLVTAGYQFLKHSEWEYARKYELDGKLNRLDVVAPSTSSADSGKAADAKATGDALGRIGQKLEVWLSVNPQTGVVSANYDDGL